jgi:N-acetylglucosaminyl-diphospho-decaprenol L-rhamnosyltransferase
MNAARLSACVVKLSAALSAASGEQAPRRQAEARLQEITRTTAWRVAQPAHRLLERSGWLRYLLRRVVDAVLGEPSAPPHRDADVEAVLASGLFDARWYAARHPNVPTDPALAARHYLATIGPHDPGPHFDARWYLANNRTAEGENVLLHYLKTGRAQLRSISPSAQRATREARRQALGLDLAVPPLRVAIGFGGVAAEPVLARARRSAELAAEQAGLQDCEILMSEVHDVSLPGAHNRLLEIAAAHSAALYLAADPQGIFDPGCLAALLRMSAASGHTALIAAADFPQENPIAFDPESFDVGWAGGGCLLIPLSVIRRVGGLEPSLNRFWDVDLSWRARQAGFAVKTCPTALFHVSRDRLLDELVDEDALLAGYGLAQLWAHSAAAAAIGAELKRYGAVLPLGQPEANGRDPAVANFAHGFGFAPARW